MRTGTAIAAIAALTASSLSAQPQTSLTPVGKWSLEYGATACVLSRNFGTATDEVTLALRPGTLSEYVELSIISDETGNGSGTAKVTLDTIPVPFESQYISQQHPTLKKRFDTFSLPRAFLNSVVGAKLLTISRDPSDTKLLALPDARSALRGLANCEADLASRWGVSPRPVPPGGTAPEPIGSPAKWVTFSDYPPDALKRRESGTVTIAWIIDTAGKVQDCRAVVSSGSASLDAKACEVIVKRARYKPAKTADGTPVAVTMSRKISWNLPVG